ncbi:MAG TPA: helix-turn-helix domain-containing protein [Polyangiales bacterium]
MSDPSPSAQVSRLLAGSVRSIEELEVLLRLRAESTAQSPRALSEVLNIPESIAESALQNLEAAGLVTRDEAGRAYRYAAADPELASAVEALAEAYRENRVQIIMTISNNAIERMRHGVLQLFSDAFRISRGKKDG